jgi:KaiC/GvpD/RAD55 family RecA-like ATPase
MRTITVPDMRDEARRRRALVPIREPGEDDADTTPIWNGTRHGEPLFLPIDDFFAKCGEGVEYILEPFLPKDGFVIVTGATKHGKTWFLGWLAGQIAAQGRTVLFIEEEGAKETLRERLQPFKSPGARIHVSHRKGWKLDDERSVNRLIEEIRAARAQVVILDPLNQLHSHARKIGEVPAEVIQAIQRVIAETGCAVILAAHTRKGESWNKDSDGEAQSADIAGSYAWAASADNIIQIKAVPNADRRPGEVRFFVENPDTRNGEPFARRLAVVRPGPFRPDSMTFTEPDSPAMKVLRELLPHVPADASEAISVENLRKAVRRGKSSVGPAVDLGVRTGALVRRVKGGGVYRGESVGPSESSPSQSEPSPGVGLSPRGEVRGPVHGSDPMATNGLGGADVR